MARKISEPYEASQAVQGDVQPTSSEFHRQTKVGQAVEKAAEMFARRPLPVGCEADDAEFLQLPIMNQCEKHASWIAIHRNSAEGKWRATFLCSQCKQEVQRVLSGNLADGESLVLVKDWRV